MPPVGWEDVIAADGKGPLARASDRRDSGKFFRRCQTHVAAFEGVVSKCVRVMNINVSRIFNCGFVFCDNIFDKIY
jgi:hypothetical protein